MASLPSLPYSRTHAVKLVYKICTDKFICSTYAKWGSAKWVYTSEIAVEKQQDYPDIPPAIWIVSLIIEASNGQLTYSVTPKDPALLLRSPTAVLVEAKTGANADGPYDDIVVIEADGWKKPQKILLANTDFASYYLDTSGQPKYDLRKGVDMFVTLILHTETAFPRADLQYLLDSNTLTDCTLICEGQEFPAHRAILAAQSPVFAAMFQDEMKEKTSGVCKIDDISQDVLQVMLKFSYTRAPLDGEGALDELWIAADKYDMKDLCSECERKMMHVINAENAVKWFDFAGDHKLKDLQMATIKLIAEHSLEID